MRSLDEQRNLVQAEQDALVRALLEPGAASPGLDESALARARCVLRGKRAWLEERRAPARAKSRWARFLRALRLA